MTSDRWSLELRARSSPEQRCAFCHGGIGASAMACSRCQTIFHEDCAAEYGRCPTMGCAQKHRTPTVPTGEPLVDEPHARRRRFFSIVRLWMRLLTIVFFLSLVAVPASLATFAMALSCSQWTPLCFLPMVIAYFAFRAIGRERAYQNGLRYALGVRRPVTVRVFSTRDGDGPRVDFRAEGADATAPVPLSVRFGLLGPPEWLTSAERVLVHGLSIAGPLVIEDAGGRRHFASEEEVTRTGVRVWRREG